MLLQQGRQLMQHLHAYTKQRISLLCMGVLAGCSACSTANVTFIDISQNAI